MGRCYEQFSLEERCTLCRLSQAGQTIRQIATAMDRAPSTIMRELRRNSSAQVGYQPAYAEQQAKSRRWREVACCVNLSCSKRCSSDWDTAGRQPGMRSTEAREQQPYGPQL